MFSSRSFLFVCFVFRLTLRSLTHLNLLLYMVWENVWILLFYVLMASFPSTIYKEAIFYPLYMTCLLCHRWAVSVWACFWALYSVPLYFLFCVSPIRFWLLLLYGIDWSQYIFALHADLLLILSSENSTRECEWFHHSPSPQFKIILLVGPLNNSWFSILAPYSTHRLSFCFLFLFFSYCACLLLLFRCYCNLCRIQL